MGRTLAALVQHCPVGKQLGGGAHWAARERGSVALTQTFNQYSCFHLPPHPIVRNTLPSPHSLAFSGSCVHVSSLPRSWDIQPSKLCFSLTLLLPIFQKFCSHSSFSIIYFSVFLKDLYLLSFLHSVLLWKFMIIFSSKSKSNFQKIQQRSLSGGGVGGMLQ